MHANNILRVDLPDVQSTDTSRPDYASPQWVYMRDNYFKRVEDLKHGTQSMRDAGELWLPSYDKEGQKKYRTRKAKSFLLNAYWNAITNVAAKPFAKEVDIEDDTLPERLSSLEENTDGEGTSLTTFTEAFFQECQHLGFSHILVDMPVKTEATTQRTIDEGKFNPMLIRISPLHLFGWNSDDQGLTQIRIWQTAEVSDGPYGTKTVNQIKVFNREAPYQLFEQQSTGANKGSSWVPVEQETEVVGINLVTCYFNKSGFMTATPVFNDLAWKNIEHWQSSSDQGNILTFARTGTYFFSGATTDEADAVAIGPNQIIHAKNPEAKFSVVEYTGKAIESGTQDIARIEKQMEAMSNKPLVEKAQMTATEVVVNEDDGLTVAQSWILTTERCLRAAIELAASMVKQSLPEDFKVTIFKDFKVSSSNQVEMTTLVAARQAKDIDQETFLKELVRRNMIATATVNKIMAATQEERDKMEAAIMDLAGASAIGNDIPADADEDEEAGDA